MVLINGTLGVLLQLVRVCWGNLNLLGALFEEGG